MTFITRCMTGLAGLVLSLGVLAALVEIAGITLLREIDSSRI
ncbi:MAG: hypothetical protein ABIV07_06960 [Polaromonas sp.]